MSSNIDKRGKRRGKCLSCKGCSEYEYVKGEIKSDCAYCGHTAPEHECLEEADKENTYSLPHCSTAPLVKSSAHTASTSKSSFQTSCASSSFFNFGLPGNISTTLSSDASSSFVPPLLSDQQSEDIEIITLEPNQSLHSFLETASSSKSAKQEMETEDIFIPLPVKLPSDLEEVFIKKTQPVNDDATNSLIREIVTCIRQKGIKGCPAVYQAASNKAVEQWPDLKIKDDKKNKGLAKKIQRRFANETSRGKKRMKTEPPTLNEMVALEKMQEDWEQNVRSVATMKTYMNVLRTTRLQAALKQSASEHLKLYPALRLTPVLMHELECQVGLKFNVMESNWYRYLPKLIEEMANQGLFSLPADASEYQKTVTVLEHLHMCKQWFKKTNVDRKSKILEVFEENTPLGETWAKNKDPPKLMALKNSQGEVTSFHCFVDVAPLFAVESPIEAMCLLLSTFYNFNIAWTPKAKMPLFLLVCVLIKPGLVMTEASHNSKFVSLLRSLGVTV